LSLEDLALRNEAGKAWWQEKASALFRHRGRALRPMPKKDKNRHSFAEGKEGIHPPLTDFRGKRKIRS